MTCRRRLRLAPAAALLLAACAAPPPPIVLEPAPPAVFGDVPAEHANRVFDLLAADMDGDGDEDLLINWHHLAAMELFENLGGRFRLANPPGADDSGLDDNPGVPELFAPSAEMHRRLATERRNGLFVWHDEDRRGRWRFAWRPPPSGPARLEIETSLEVGELAGVDPDQIVSRTERTLALALAAGRPQDFALATRQVTIGVSLLLRTPTGEAVPIYVGRRSVPRPAGAVELWKPDPHGIAWADVDGDSRPEIFVTRGALIGQLRPPARGKRDGYFLPAADSLYAAAPDGTVPRDRSRGRRVEWVDVDGDGRAELSLSAEASPNRLLALLPGSGELVDRAPELGLDLEESAVQSWGDHDGDGRQDAYVLAAGQIDILRNRDGGSFERLAGTSLGLVLPESFEPAVSQFDFSALRLADFDADGDLDLWLLAAGRRRSNHLFRRDGDRFTDVSERVGLDRLTGNLFAVLCDLDGDGFEDGFSSGRLAAEPESPAEAGGRALLWRNRGGRELRFERLPAALVPRAIHAAACLDADGDGRSDIAAAGPERLLLLNRTVQRGSWVDLLPADGGRGAIGAVVSLAYSDGRRLSRRYGSARNSAFSQALAPLRFAVPPGARVERLLVRWPGETTDSVYPPPEPGTLRIIERRAPPASAVQPPT